MRHLFVAMLGVLLVLAGCSQNDSDEVVRVSSVGGPIAECTGPMTALPGEDPNVVRYEATFTCGPNEMSDPRVTGTETWEFYDFVWVKEPEMLQWWADVTLTTDEGVWRGRGFGGDLFDDAGRLHTTFYAEFDGEGPYDGLTYQEWGAQSPELGGYQLSGLIRPSDE